MKPLIILDAGPLGFAGKAAGRPESIRFYRWLQRMRSDGADVAVPAIARYEVRRELFRAGLAGALSRLDRLHPDLVFLGISDQVMDIASELWATVRRAGQPTAPDDALDGDAILAAQAIVAAEEWGGAVVATTNVGHLARFPGVVARDWWEIS